VSFVITLPARPSLAIAGAAERFPVRRVYCVGRNYPEHAREVGHDPLVEPPFFFGKPADALVQGDTVRYPPATGELHHEVELVVALADGGADLDADEACACIFGYAVGVDLTRRDLQRAAKAKGQPWDMSKGFDESAPLGLLQPASRIGHPRAGAIELAVNGGLRQRGDLAQMSWPVPAVIARLSQLVRLAPGDLIFTGTPAGIGALQRGDRVHAQIAGVGEHRFTVT
jgi:fumarylpyruvate hydrolase